MPGIDNITDKILKDAEAKAALIIQNAEEKASADRQEIIDGANREKERILAEAEILAVQYKEQASAGNNIDMRDRKLAAKQKIIEKVFSESLKRLNNLDQDEFEKFVSAFCKTAEIKENDKILLPDKYKDADAKKIDPRLSAYLGERSVSGGFILISDGIEQNNTFSALLDFIKNDIEPEVVSKLF